ncbi:MAG TPA: SagB/ThcOx family dehydrogenase [Phycisphaerae bacterium]|nr:SagB/ThcOx family dehydrogenase [Phycisphaerae bacterium]HRY69563.1 SagB/ThcOx family dehydrogenase [Phycisphaerae bacterium]HSA26204.1 SagB/ThcOx family dehydrogenase [Phycisphaerae bacterium]
MDRRMFLKSVPAFAVLASRTPSFGEEMANPPAVLPELKPITLPKPEKEGGKSVMAALWERRTNRSLSDRPLPPQMLSNLLWAAWGVNREGGASGRIGRTAASASNSQEIDLYVFLAEGVYLYEAVPHRLAPVLAGDQREKVGRRGRGNAAAKAPVNLVFVADLAKFNRGTPQEPGLKDPEIQKSYYNIAAGLIAGNVYLFAASQGLAAWFRNCNKTGLAADLKLRPEQRVLYAQTVGYPA